MKSKPPLPEVEMAFRTAKKDNVFEAVQALKEKLNLSQGSVVAHANLYAAYDFYELLNVYMNDHEARLNINEIVKESQANGYGRS